MRDNPALDEATVITELGVGEALVSCLDAKGRPGMVEHAYIVPPQGQIGPITDAQRRQLMQTSLVAGVYDKTVDRESAHEILKARAAQATQAAAAEAGAKQQAKTERASGSGAGSVLGDLLGGGRREGAVEAMAKSAARAIGSQVGRAIIRGVLGSIFGGKR
jgi:DNA helicase HerA-like ATPase